jgi:hypothetical protein
MVKGISKQVIVLQSPQTQAFEQAIFILREGAPAVTDQQLLKEAQRLCSNPILPAATGGRWFYAGMGALAVGLLWLVTTLI